MAGKPKIWLVQACRRGESQLTQGRRATAARRGAGGSEADGATAPIACAETVGAAAATGETWQDGLPPEDNAVLCEEHDHLWGYAATPGSPAYRGAMFGAFRRVAEARGETESWLALLQHTNELCAATSPTFDQ